MSTQGAPAGWLERYAAQGTTHSDIGIIFVHGFTGSPASMRPWAHYFNDRGYTVRVPLLLGHGTQWQDLNTVNWQEWPQMVQKEIDELRPQVKKIFIFGLSMGGGTTLNVAEKNEIDGICLVNPMIHIPGVQIKFSKLISLVISHLSSVGDDIKKEGVTEWGYDHLPTKGVVQLHKMLKATRKNLEKVGAPILLFHSVDDHVLEVLTPTSL